MKSKVQAILNIDEGEEIAGGWASAHIPQVWIYKLLAKKRKDGHIEWAHFVQRDKGLKERIYRGTLDSSADLDLVIEIMNRHLKRIFGVTMQSAQYDVYSLDGKKAPSTRH
ncbi:MAG TPA: hypothetical protein VGJ22_03270 [Anaerolineales bacterium]|jgi:hypothetical protein